MATTSSSASGNQARSIKIVTLNQNQWGWMGVWGCRDKAKSPCSQDVLAEQPLLAII